MKKKVIKIKSAKNMRERLAGLGTFRVTGPCKNTGNRVTVEFVGTREQADALELVEAAESENS